MAIKCQIPLVYKSYIWNYNEQKIQKNVVIYIDPLKVACGNK